MKENDLHQLFADGGQFLHERLLAGGKLNHGCHLQGKHSAFTVKVSRELKKAYVNVSSPELPYYSNDDKYSNMHYRVT